MDIWQDAVPYPMGEATAEAGGQHEPVSGGLKPGAGALLGILGSSSSWAGGMLTMTSHGGGLHRSLMLGKQMTFLMA